MLGEVNGEACRSYRKKGRNRGGARRDLEDLRAAVGHHAAEGYKMQKRSRRPTDDVKAPTAKRPLRHLARFILLRIYSVTRAGAIASASPMPAVGRSFVDLERGRYYRRQQGSAKTNKRQPTVPLPLRLLGHLRRWHRSDPETKHFVEFNGKPVSQLRQRSRAPSGSRGSVQVYRLTRCATRPRLG